MFEIIFLQVLHLAAYMVLVAGLVGLLRGVWNRRHFGGSADAYFLGAFLPIVAGAVSKLIGKKGQQSREQQALDQAEAERRRSWTEAEQGRQRDWEERYGSPEAESGRMRATLRLGRLLGLFGGREGAPPSLVSHLTNLRTRPEYEAGTYAPGGAKAPGIGGWGLAESLVNSAGYYNPRKRPMAMPKPGSAPLMTGMMKD